MAPSWIFAFMLVLSTFLAIGQANSIRFCGDDRKSQCVEEQFCGPEKGVTLRRIQCPDYQVCCLVEEINNLSAGEIDEYA